MKRNKFNIPICNFDKIFGCNNFIYQDIDFYFNYNFKRYIRNDKTGRLIGFGIFLKKSKKFY